MPAPYCRTAAHPPAAAAAHHLPTPQGALLNAVIIGCVNLVATFVSIAVVDRLGRRPLFLQGGAQMFTAQVAVGILLGVAFGQYNTQTLPNSITIIALVLICIFVAGYAWSWGE